ncbi:hypothetical protein GU700_13690 [Methylobacterium sp. NI91]|nr:MULTISPECIES: hypothetical protein [unclassified Methylobacterium]QIJ80463.1 hypothetical protein GU700_13690 [Methylobacterium sp. NI91]
MSVIRHPSDCFGFYDPPSSRGEAEAIQGATFPDNAEPWIATASPRNDGMTAEAINWKPFDQAEFVPPRIPR